VIGALFVVLMWGLYLARLFWGIGPMRDLQGNPAPAAHYLAGAVIVTLMVVAWISGREWFQRRQR
jgi:hypothetical protein